jgi:hypothetical protein
VGVTRYDIHRTNTTTNTFSNTTVVSDTIPISGSNISASTNQTWASNVSSCPECGVTYSFYVVAVDAAGNVSPPSPTLTVTVPNSLSSAAYRRQYSTNGVWQTGSDGVVRTGLGGIVNSHPDMQPYLAAVSAALGNIYSILQSLKAVISGQ